MMFWRLMFCDIRRFGLACLDVIYIVVPNDLWPVLCL